MRYILSDIQGAVLIGTYNVMYYSKGKYICVSVVSADKPAALGAPVIAAPRHTTATVPASGPLNTLPLPGPPSAPTSDPGEESKLMSIFFH